MKIRNLVLIDVLHITVSNLKTGELAVFCLYFVHRNTIDVSNDSNCATSAMLYGELAVTAQT